jgi:hypothetical protein
LLYRTLLLESVVPLLDYVTQSLRP